MILRILIGLSLVFPAIVADAGPLDRNRVPEDVQWLIHIDFDAMRQSEIGQHMIGEAEYHTAETVPET